VSLIELDGPWFKDEDGRTLILRGVNLGGSSKVPYRPNGATYIRAGFYDHRKVSFVGRPFPLDEADEHFARLRSWGFTFLRFLVTWEAVEHFGPGIYDQEYLDYLVQVVSKAGEHGIQLLIDPHQDVWSRMSGGDGAPGWTFEVLGMDVTKFTEAGAAIVHAIHGDPFPRMIWPSNYAKLAAATMFTLFFGGNDFAPRTSVDGEPVQEFLQRHYINAVKQIVLRLKDQAHVVGYDTLNEPSAGFIGREDLTSSGGLVRLGESPSPFESMLLGAGFPQLVDVWEVGIRGPRLRERRRLNPLGVRVWDKDHDCVWRQNGVWDVGADGTPQLLDPDHFSRVAGRRVDFAQDYLRAFFKRYAREIRSVDSDAIIFLEDQPGTGRFHWGAEDPPKVVHAAHWYDGVTLYTKHYRPYLAIDLATGRLLLTPRGNRRSFSRQLARIRQDSAQRMGGIPTLIGELGIPFDMQNKQAYQTGDFSLQVQALDASLRAIEDNCLSCTLWNYTADNDNLHGDQWNDEDLSIFSRDQQTDRSDINSGGRALRAAVRPYARAVAGEPLRMNFDVKRRTFEFEFRHDPAVLAPTEVFLPAYQYPDGCVVQASDGTYEVRPTEQILVYRHTTGRGTHRIQVRPR
jgi:hypothetical protein